MLMKKQRSSIFVDSELEIDKYAFFFEGQSYTIRSPRAGANTEGRGLERRASHALKNIFASKLTVASAVQGSSPKSQGQ